MNPFFFFFLFFSLLTIVLPVSLHNQISSVSSEYTDPAPAPRPHQFHAILFMNNSGALQKVDLWYDWPNSRNFKIIQNQLSKLTYDLEWNNGTSHIYTLDSNKECRALRFSVAYFGQTGWREPLIWVSNTWMGFSV